MGYVYARGLAESEIDLETAVRIHLTVNCFPPVPVEMLEPALEAIKLCNEMEAEATVETPFEHRRYGTNVPACALVDCLCLEAFLEGGEDEGD